MSSSEGRFVHSSGKAEGATRSLDPESTGEGSPPKAIRLAIVTSRARTLGEPTLPTD